MIRRRSRLDRPARRCSNINPPITADPPAGGQTLNGAEAMSDNDAVSLAP